MVSMSFKDLAEQVGRCVEKPENWKQVRIDILNQHEDAVEINEYITLLSLHKMLMDSVEEHSSNDINLDKIKKIHQQDYKALIIRECTIGGSICVDTLYEITQRELEAGRMNPAHELINLAVDATAEPHYSREQLLRQKEKINELDKNTNIGRKLSKIFKPNKF